MVLGVLAVSAAACGSDDGAVANPASPPATTSVVETTVETTTSSTTSTPTSTSTTTTLPAATTTVPTETLINQAVQDYSLAYHQCGMAPAVCDPTSFTATQGPSRSIVTKFATDMVQQGLYFSPDSRGSYIVVESVDVVSAKEATAVGCIYDAGTVLGPTGPDGLPTVLNDQILSLRNQYHLYLDEGGWRVGEKHELERLGEGNLCLPAA